MAQDFGVFQSNVARVLAPTLFAIFFAALVTREFPKSLGVLLHCGTAGKSFHLSGLRANSLLNGLFTRDLLYADDAGLRVDL